MARYEINESVTEPKAVFGTDLSTVQAAVPKNGAPVVARDAGTTTSRALYAAASGGSALTQPILTVNGRIEAYVEGETPVDLLINYGLSNQYTQRFTPPQVGPAGPTGPAGAAGTSGGSTAVGAKFYRDTFGTFDQAVVGSFVGNRTSAPTTQVMGTTDTAGTLERGSAAVAIDNTVRLPTVDSTSTTFTATTVTFGAGVDLTNVVAGMIVDAGGAEHVGGSTSGFVQSVAGQTVTLNFQGWRSGPPGVTAATPANGTRVRINRMNKAFGLALYVRNAIGAQVSMATTEADFETAYDYGADGFNGPTGVHGFGIDSFSPGSNAGSGTAAFTARGKWWNGFASSGVYGSDSGHFRAHANWDVYSGPADVAFYDDNSGSLVGFKKRATAGTDATFSAHVGTEASPRYWFDANGKHSRGDGTVIDESNERTVVGSVTRTKFSQIVHATGSFITSRNTAPADATLQANEMAIWFDPTNGSSALKIKAKQADGTVRSATVALA